MIKGGFVAGDREWDGAHCVLGAFDKTIKEWKVPPPCPARWMIEKVVAKHLPAKDSRDDYNESDDPGSVICGAEAQCQTTIVWWNNMIAAKTPDPALTVATKLREIASYLEADDNKSAV